MATASQHLKPELRWLPQVNIMEFLGLEMTHNESLFKMHSVLQDGAKVTAPATAPHPHYSWWGTS